MSYLEQFLPQWDDMCAAVRHRAAGRALHRPEQRWVTHPDDERSYKDRQDAVDELMSQYDLPVCLIKPHSFTICVECARIEQAEEQRDPGQWPIGHLNSLWPCATAQALGEDR